jgi:hypothetical protein
VSDEAGLATARILDGAAWRDFCARLAEAGEVILAPDMPATPLDRAEGFRYLSRLVRIALEMNLEASDPDFPFFYKASHETAKIGADNPDNIYWNATVSGDCDYRISGRRGTMAYFSIGSKANRYHIDGTMASTGELYDEQIPWGPDGTFEIIASASKKPGAWLPMAADTSFIIIRQSYLDRAAETPGDFRIERLGGPAAPAPFDPVRLDAALTRTAAFVRGTASTFADWARLFRQQPNQLPQRDQQMYWRAGGDPNIYYLHGYYEIAADEAWVIEVTPPDCPYWNFQLDNWWMESLDYRFRKISVNKHTARLDKGGKLTLVVADRDVGLGEWIDASGHQHGTALLRWVGASEHPVPRCRVEKLSRLEGLGSTGDRRDY